MMKRADKFPAIPVSNPHQPESHSPRSGQHPSRPHGRLHYVPRLDKFNRPHSVWRIDKTSSRKTFIRQQNAMFLLNPGKILDGQPLKIPGAAQDGHADDAAPPVPCSFPGRKGVGKNGVVRLYEISL